MALITARQKRGAGKTWRRIEFFLEKNRVLGNKRD